ELPPPGAGAVNSVVREVMLRQLLSGPTTSESTDAGNLQAMLSNVAATTLPFASSSVSGTSELFSSTFAMLSEGDGIADAWEKPRVYEGGMEEFARFNGDFTHQFEQTRLPFLPYPGQPIGLPVPTPIMGYGMHLAGPAAAAAVAAPMFGHPMGIPVGAAPPPPRPQPILNGFHPHTSLAAPIPITPQSTPSTAISGSPDDGRPHTGRSYVESLGGAAPKGATVAPIRPPSESSGSPPKPGKGMVSSTGEGGLSPICPHCERFISHYKGNIRRHINQCCKNGGKRMKTPKNPMCGGTSSTSGKRRKFTAGSDGTPSSEGWGAAPGPGEMTLFEHITTTNFPAPPLPVQPLVQPPIVQQQPNPLYDLPPSSTSESEVNADSTTPTKKISESDVPDDPYLCPCCDFLTVYKGNMKRHMNTCHPAELEKGDTRLDDMRASVQGVANEELNAKLNAHKMNSTRGRKPKVGKLGMDTSGSSHSPNGNDHSLGSGGSSTTSPMSAGDPYYRPPVSGHIVTQMMPYSAMGYPQPPPQHLLMVAPGAPPGYYHPAVVQQMQLQQPQSYLQQASLPHSSAPIPSMLPAGAEINSENDRESKKEEVKSEDESDFDDDDDESDEEESKDAASAS
ncbi:hypothetical protein PFISCL1PPCAC_1515, partial [Pristionchus fissidentatus]